MAMTVAHPHPLFNELTPGSRFHQYHMLEQIGVGGQGVVWSALDQNRKQIHAIKFNEVQEADRSEADDIQDERQLEQLVKLQHAHILPILEYGFEQQVRFTVSPYIPGGTLTQKIRIAPLSVAEIVRYGTEIASALDYLHTQGIIHRDLKSANILLDLRNNCYLADFGLARLVSTSTLAFHTGHGTPPYAPPEQIQSKAITPKSDIFSFGILLYEMFTSQLPWNGKKQLGMEQLNSKQELPDPREFNNNLPLLLIEVLRRATSADPALRPSSTGEVMRAIRRIFNIESDFQLDEKKLEGWMIRDNDLDELLKRTFKQWQASDETYNLGLTKFALINLERKKINTDLYSNFMLSQALTYGYNDDKWWVTVGNPRERLAVSSKLFKKHNEVITGRIITHLASDPNIKVLPESMTVALLETGIKTDNAFLRREIFEGVKVLTQPKTTWSGQTLDPNHAKRLGAFAHEDSEFGDTTAELIGHLRSTMALQVILKYPDDERKIAALLLIQRVAGSLPTIVPSNIRFRLFVESVLQRLIQNPISLISAYMFAFLGAALGIGLQVYVTTRVPNLLDTIRITNSLEMALIVGAVFGLGIFIIRLIVERFQAFVTLPRVFFATIMGVAVLNVAMLTLHVLYLTTPPSGFLITPACMLIALTFAVGGLFRSRLLKMFLSSVSVFTAILGTWWLHASYAVSIMDLTPFFVYDYSWSLTQIALTAFGIAVSIGIFGNLINLSIIEG